MKILIDMNLSPRWRAALEIHGFSSLHWAQVGDPRASDRSIMEWAAENGYSVLTYDMDFGSALAATQAEKPSVILLRVRDLWPEVLETLLVEILTKHQTEIEAGAMVVVEADRSRVRILPIRKSLKK